MSLPNFVNFEPFNQLRRKMHAEHLGRFGRVWKPDVQAVEMPEMPVEAPDQTPESTGKADEDSPR